MAVSVVGISVCDLPKVWAHSNKSAVAVKTYSPIAIDGKLDDWIRRLESSNWPAKLEMQKGNVLQLIRASPIYVNALSATVEAGSIVSPQDFSAIVYTMWDEKMFYAAAVINDDQSVTEHEHGDIWQDDALELWFDCRHDSITHTLAQDDEYQVGFSPAGPKRNKAIVWSWRNPQPEPVILGSHVASARTPSGYLLEGSIPWKALKGCHPAIGGMMGFNISIVDKDEDQLWTHITWAGALHSDPSQFGHLYFVDAPIDLFPADVFEIGADARPLEPLEGMDQ
jgi:hypothetical protein